MGFTAHDMETAPAAPEPTDLNLDQEFDTVSKTEPPAAQPAQPEQQPDSAGLVEPSHPDGDGAEYKATSQMADVPPIDNTPEPETPMWDVFGASVAINNPFFNMDFKHFEQDPSYSPFDDVEGIRNYDPRDFENSVSQAHTDHIKSKIDLERFARKELANAGGFTGWLADTAGVMSNPILYLPGLLATKLPTIIFSEMLVESFSEFINHTNQYEKTYAESALNVVGTGLFAGVVGGAAMQLAKKADIVKGNKAAGDLFVGPPKVVLPDVPDFDMMPEPGTVGAKMVDTNIDDETMIGGAVAQKASAGVMGRLLGSPFLAARKLAQDLADNPFQMRKHKEGISSGPSVESMMGEHEGMMATALQGARSQFQKYKDRGGTMTHPEFEADIGRVLSNGRKNAHPEVLAASDYHRTLYDLDKDWAINTGRLPENVHPQGAQSYRKRLYDRKKLRTKQELFVSIMTDHLYNGIKHGTLVKVEMKGKRMAIPATHVEQLKRQNPGMVALDSKMPNDLSMRNEAQTIAEQVHRDLINFSPADSPVTGLVGPAGSLEARTIGLSDQALEPFLEQRADLILRAYSAEMSFDKAIFDKLGDHSLDDTLDAIAKDAHRQVGKAPENQREKLAKRLEQDIKDLKALRDRVAHKYGRPDDWTGLHTAGAAIRTYTNMTSLGGVAITSIPDLARIPMKYGFGPFMGGISRIMKGHRKLSKSARTNMGIAIDRITSGRFRSLAEASDDVRNPTHKAQEGFFHVAFMNNWTDYMQGLSSEVFADTAIKWMRSGTKKQKTMLGRAGIDSEVAEKILKEYDESGTLDPRMWQDVEAGQYWGAALRNEMKHTIVEPGAGDLYLWQSTETGKFIGQFKSFMVASHNKMLITGVQQNDANFYSGLIFSMMLSGMVAEFKNGVRSYDSKDDVFDKLFNSADRTGILGVFAVPAVTTYSLMGGTPSRRISQDLTGTAFGPNIGRVERLAKTVSKAASGDKVKPKEYLGHIPLLNLHHMKDIAIKLNE